MSTEVITQPIEVVENLKRKATFKIKKSDVDAHVKQEIAKHAKTAKIQGFRPGKVPAKIVEQMYGGQAFEEAMNIQINKQFRNLVVEHNISIVDEPTFEIAESEGDEFVFNATFEVFPEFTIGDLSTQEFDKYSCSIAESDIDELIGTVLKKGTKHVAADEKATASSGDLVTIDFVGTVDGVAFDGGSANDYPFTLGEGRMLKEFEDGVTGLNVGQSRDVEVNFPADYHAENLQGKKAIFSITLKKLEKPVVPELNEEFIRSVGVIDGTVETLRKEVLLTLEYGMKNIIYNLARENAFNALDNVCSFELPKSLVHNEIHYLMDKQKERMLQQGYSEDQIKLTHEMFEEQAKKLVRLRLIANKFVEEHKITINDDDIAQTIKNLTEHYGDNSEAYAAWYREDKQRMTEARSMSIERKVIEKIESMVKLNPKDVSYSELQLLAKN